MKPPAQHTLSVAHTKRLDALVRRIARIRRGIRKLGVPEPTRDEIIDLALDYYESAEPL